MARKQCQVCGQPATVRVEANLNGRHSTMLLCDDHYRQLVRQQKRTVSPLEALFGARSGLFEDFLGSDFFRIGDESATVAADADDVVDASFHEMGHALVALALPGTDPVHKVSIVPRGIGALGYTLQRPTEDRFLMTRADLEHKIAVLLGGRAAEKLVFGELSTGASDDLARATDIARDMITRYGMDEGLGYVAFEAQRPRFLDAPELAQGGCRVAESTQARIDQAIRDIVMGVFDRAYRILEINREVLERCARELLARETLDEYSIRQLTQGLQLESPCHGGPTAGAITSPVSQGATS